MRAYERLLHYVSFGTQSDHTSETVPSTASQKVLAADLVEEMKKIGIADAFVDDKGYVAFLPPRARRTNRSSALSLTWTPRRMLPVTTSGQR